MIFLSEALATTRKRQTTFTRVATQVENHWFRQLCNSTLNISRIHCSPRFQYSIAVPLSLIFNAADFKQNLLWNFPYLDKNWNIYKCSMLVVQKRPRLLFQITEELTVWMSGWKQLMSHRWLYRKQLLSQEYKMKLVYKNSHHTIQYDANHPNYPVSALDQLVADRWILLTPLTERTKFSSISLNWRLAVQLHERLLCIFDEFWYCSCSCQEIEAKQPD